MRVKRIAEILQSSLANSNPRSPSRRQRRGHFRSFLEDDGNPHASSEEVELMDLNDSSPVALLSNSEAASDILMLRQVHTVSLRF